MLSSVPEVFDSPAHQVQYVLTPDQWRNTFLGPIRSEFVQESQLNAASKVYTTHFLSTMCFVCDAERSRVLPELHRHITASALWEREQQQQRHRSRRELSNIGRGGPRERLQSSWSCTEGFRERFDCHKGGVPCRALGVTGSRCPPRQRWGRTPGTSSKHHTSILPPWNKSMFCFIVQYAVRIS